MKTDYVIVHCPELDTLASPWRVDEIKGDERKKIAYFKNKELACEYVNLIRKKTYYYVDYNSNLPLPYEAIKVEGEHRKCLANFGTAIEAENYLKCLIEGKEEETMCTGCGDTDIELNENGYCGEC